MGERRESAGRQESGELVTEYVAWCIEIGSVCGSMAIGMKIPNVRGLSWDGEPFMY